MYNNYFNKKTINSLTSFRFLTALVVFLFHLNIHIQWKVGIKIVDQFFANGATFMTGFFVLSGFIMTYVYQDINFINRENIFDYYLKRFAKIYPIYILATIVYFTCYSLEFLKSPLRVIFNDIFLVQAFFPSMFEIGINSGTWSLTVEMYLYFIFPFLIILLNKNVKLSILIGIGITLLVTLNVKLNQSDAIYHNPIFRVGDFMVGMGFCFMLDKFKSQKNIKILHGLSIILLFLNVVFLGKHKYQYMLGQVIIVPLFGLYIFSIYKSKSFFYNNIITIYLGKISYSFYIWQFFSIQLGKYMIKFNLLNIHFIALLCLVLNIIISIISYHFLEEPCRKIIINSWVKSRLKINT